jgi:hypothetical protein
MIYWFSCVLYCIWRTHLRSQKTSLDGFIGSYPGFDMLMSIALGPVLAPIDICISFFKLYKDAEQVRIYYSNNA